MADFKIRCCETFAETIKNVQDGSCVGFVVHGGVIMAILEAYARPKKDFYATTSETANACKACMTEKQFRSNSEYRQHSGYLSGTADGIFILYRCGYTVGAA